MVIEKHDSANAVTKSFSIEPSSLEDGKLNTTLTGLVGEQRLPEITTFHVLVIGEAGITVVLNALLLYQTMGKKPVPIQMRCHFPDYGADVFNHKVPT